MKIEKLIQAAREAGASDIHVSEGLELAFRISGMLTPQNAALSDAETRDMILAMLTEKQQKELKAGEDLDFAIQTADGCRQRVNVFCQQGRLAATIRLLNSTIPSLDQLGLPAVLSDLAREPRGLVLVTGPTGSGKSTTLAAMIQQINESRAEHIVTIEDPIEYVYKPDKSLIHQREVGSDVKDFAYALRSVLREDPDVILVGEMRDYETISAALTAAETGHLVFSTLHTTGAAQTIDRIIDACPTNSQNQIRIQLAGILKGVITQCLIPDFSGGRVAATEVLTGTDAVLNLVRENKCHQLGTLMQSGSVTGMHTLNQDLIRLLREGRIRPDLAMKYSNDKKELEQLI